MDEADNSSGSKRKSNEALASQPTGLVCPTTALAPVCLQNPMSSSRDAASVWQEPK